MPTSQFNLVAWPAMPAALSRQVRDWSAGLADQPATGLPSAPLLDRLPPRRRAALHLAAAQALDFHRPLRSSPAIEALHARLRAQVARLAEDRLMAPDIALATALVEEGATI